MSESESQKKNVMAEESAKTLKARHKLKKQLEILDQKITPQALEKKMREIHQWISRHAQHRVVLKTKTISLFDENQHTAEISHKISELAQKLQAEGALFQRQMKKIQ